MKEEKTIMQGFTEQILLKKVIKILKNKYNIEESKKKIEEELKKYIIKEEGFLYCIENDIYSVYEERIYKIGNTNNIKTRIMNYNSLYIDKCIIKNEIKVNNKYLYEFIIMFRLQKNRKVYNREFFKNYEEIDKEFKLLEKMIMTKTEEEIKKYYIEEMITNYKKMLGLLDEELYYKNTNKKDINIKNIDMDIKKILNKEIINKGYLHYTSIKPIDYYYENKVSILIQTVCKKINNFDTSYIEIPKIIKTLEVRYLDMAKYIINDIMKNYTIKSNHYLCNKLKITELLEIIKYYFDKYKTKKDIYYSYINDRYNYDISKIKIENNIRQEYSMIYIKYMKEEINEEIDIKEMINNIIE